MQIIHFQYRNKTIFSLVVRAIFIALLITVSFFKKSNAQKTESKVMNSFGSSVSVNGKTFDASIGELATTTIAANGYLITQGFLQPIDLKTPCGDVVLKAFPNPVTVGMKIYAEGCDIEVASIKTYDLFGKLVYESRLVNNQVNFSSIGVGVYLIRAYNQVNQVVGVVKVIKSTI